MARLPIIYAPDPLLKMISQPVDAIDKALQSFLDDMLETMYIEDGAGLAAVQVGVLKRILVMDTSTVDGHKDPRFIINPVVVEHSPTVICEREGCISFPGIVVERKHYETITIRYLDYFGKEQELSAKGLASKCIQHEMNHLNGITMIDDLSPLKREMLLKKVAKYRKLSQA